MRNPPWILPFIAPLALFSLPVAASGWIACAIVAALLSIHLLNYRNVRLPLAALLFAPVVGCAMAGQVSAFILLGTALIFRLVERKPFFAGLCVLLLALKPHLFLLVWPVLLVDCIRRGRRRFLAAAFSGLAFASIFSLTTDPSIWADYLRAIRAEHIENQYLPNLPCMLRAILPSHPYWIQVAPAVLGLAWSIRYYHRHRNSWNWLDHGSLLLCVSVLVSPYSWPFDQVLVLPAVLQGCSAQLSKRALALLFLLNGILAVQFLSAAPLNSAAYAWTGFAWMVWCSWARLERRGLSTQQASVKQLDRTRIGVVAASCRAITGADAGSLLSQPEA